MRLLTGANKPAVLERLREDGFWLIDAVDERVNKAARTERRRRVRAAAPRLVERCLDVAPRRGVLVCHDLVFEAAAEPLRAAGVRLVQGQSIPFPLGNWRTRFAREVREALGLPPLDVA